MNLMEDSTFVSWVIFLAESSSGQNIVEVFNTYAFQI